MSIAVPILLLVGLGVTACVPPGFACTTVGYMSTARITLAEPRQGLSLELCDGGACEPSPPMGPPRIQPVATSPPPVIEDTGVWTLTGNSVDGWSADFSGGQPVVGYRLVDGAGVTVAEGEVDVDWVRVGGTEQCGGPRRAEIQLPA